MGRSIGVCKPFRPEILYLFKHLARSIDKLTNSQIRRLQPGIPPVATCRSILRSQERPPYGSCRSLRHGVTYFG